MVIPDIEVFRAALQALDDLPTHRMSYRWIDGRIDTLRDYLTELIESLGNLREED